MIKYMYTLNKNKTCTERYTYMYTKSLDGVNLNDIIAMPCMHNNILPCMHITPCTDMQSASVCTKATKQYLILTAVKQFKPRTYMYTTN